MPSRIDEEKEIETSVTPPDATDETNGLLFSCLCESVRPIVTLLSCLRSVSVSGGGGSGSSLASMQGATQSLLTATNDRRMTQGTASGATRGSKMQYASVFCSEKGLTFMVYGVGKQSRATVELQAGLFSEFQVSEQSIIVDDGHGDDEEKTEVIKGGEFGINLTTVIGCLCVLGPSSLNRTKLSLSYDVSAAIFKIELLEQTGLTMGGSGVIISNCAIPGMSVEDDFDDDEVGHESGLDYAFRSEPIVARARLQSEFLKNAISELTEVAGAVSVTVGISKVGLELATFGHSTECHVVVPYAGNHPEIFLSLVGIDDAIHARSYPMASILSAMRGLEIANETCVSMNGNGMIAIQHQVVDKIGNGDPCYVDFIMGCLQDSDEDSEMEEDSNPTTFIRQTQASNQSSERNEFSPGNVDAEGESQTCPSVSQTTEMEKVKTYRSIEVNEEEEENTEDEQEESQESRGISLFGAVASVGARTRESSSGIKRRLNSVDGNTNEESQETESEASQDEECEFEDSIDVTATINLSRRKTSRKVGDDSISSPQLMYGDIHLEASDDEK